MLIVINSTFVAVVQNLTDKKDKKPVNLRALAFLDDHVSRLRFLTLRLDLSRVEVAIRASWAPMMIID